MVCLHGRLQVLNLASLQPEVLCGGPLPGRGLRLHHPTVLRWCPIHTRGHSVLIQHIWSHQRLMRHCVCSSRVVAHTWVSILTINGVRTTWFDNVMHEHSTPDHRPRTTGHIPPTTDHPHPTTHRTPHHTPHTTIHSTHQHTSPPTQPSPTPHNPTQHHRQNGRATGS